MRWRDVTGSIVWALVSIACQPPPPTQPAAPPESPQDESAIPWADGAPPEDSTRQVAEQPASMDDPMTVEDSSSSVGLAQNEAAGRCTGKATIPLKAEVQARAAELKSCGQRAPSDAAATGTLKYTLRVEADGRVDTIALLEDSLEVPAVRACVEVSLKQSFDEAPRGGCVQFVLPIEFIIAPPGAEVPSEFEQ